MAEKDLEFSRRLERYMKAAGFNNKKLAEAIGVSPSTIGGYINEGRIPEAPILFDISRSLNVSMEELLTGEMKEEQPPATEKYRPSETAAPRVQERIAQYRRDEDMDPKLAILLQKVKLVYTRGDDKQRATLRGIIEEVFDEISKRELDKSQD